MDLPLLTVSGWWLSSLICLSVVDMAVARSIEMVFGCGGLKLMVKLFDSLMGCFCCWKCCGAGQTARTVLLTTNKNVSNNEEEDIFAGRKDLYPKRLYSCTLVTSNVIMLMSC